MGYYIETKEPLNKAEQLLKEHPEIQPVLLQPTFDNTLDTFNVCVVSNGMFDAAAIAYSPEELAYFLSPNDTRKKIWLKVPRHLILQLCPSISKRLTA